MTSWKIYYRGSLSSCNYGCDYCPFAKTKNTRDELVQDQREVEQFVDWVASQRGQSISILFTPWGEALGHRYYRRALIRLSLLPQVQRVCIQTNLSAPLSDFERACKQSLALWTTYHPTQTARSKFVAKCQELLNLGVRFSVGIVGLKEHFQEMEQLRKELPASIYLWVNAYKRDVNYYGSEDLERIQTVDPHFFLNNRRYPSEGRACGAGESHFTIDGAGNLRRCHFVSEVLANIYKDDWQSVLSPRLCPQETCGCYIGYIHRPQLYLEELYGDDLLARIPVNSGFS